MVSGVRVLRSEDGEMARPWRRRGISEREVGRSWHAWITIDLLSCYYLLMGFYGILREMNKDISLEPGRGNKGRD